MRPNGALGSLYLRHELEFGPDQIMCRAFPVTLKGAAHVWFQHLTPRSISCSAQLAESFRSNFLTRRVQRKNSSALFRIIQGPKESLKSYYARFNSEKILIDHLDPGVTFAAMARGVRPGTPLRFSLNKRPPENMSDLLDRVEKYPFLLKKIQPPHSTKKRTWDKKGKIVMKGKPGMNPSAHEQRSLRQVNLTQGPAKQTKASTSMEFDDADLDRIRLSHDDALVINLRIDTFQGEANIFSLIWLRRFISKSTEHCLPFFKALKNIKNFEWTTECQASFDALKEYLTSPPFLSKHVLEEDLFLYLAVAESAVSTILVREQDGQQLPVYYASKVLQGAEQRDILMRRSWHSPY
ncbi:hypothetical protein RJ639_033964 [Escallonia herrerae]|uniref:Retrotransposon gag domain-containing protein n=1 Tax=Escallonia herrerae TaxID=1293975 RepID=A0AA89BBB8_9ASTE|nr:hypothetical protein RJ639_033964 [Escallonia herrerae]